MYAVGCMRRWSAVHVNDLAPGANPEGCGWRLWLWSVKLPAGMLPAGMLGHSCGGILLAAVGYSSQ